MQPDSAFVKSVFESLRAMTDPLHARIRDLEHQIKSLEAVPGPQGPPGRDGTDGAAGPAGPKGDDGRDGLDGLHGKDGSNGLDGKDGVAGRDGRDGLAGIQGEKGLDGKDGRDGVNGKDGLGFDDMTEEFDGERTITRRYVNGDRVKEFQHKFSVVLYRGVFEEGKSYEQGDSVTWGGAMYVAKRATSMKPAELGANDWQLAVRRGRDGRAK